MAEARRRSSMGRRRTSVHDDAAMLAGMGVKQELQRNFSFLSMLGLVSSLQGGVAPTETRVLRFSL